MGAQLSEGTLEPSRLNLIHLALDESPIDHPCADVRQYHSDLALLGYLLQDLRALVRRAAAGEIPLIPYEQRTWEVHGLRRRTVVCDPEEIVKANDVLMVGFFGDRRVKNNDSIIESAELDVISEFRSYPGIMSYSSVELVDDQWANLVVHRASTDREEWRHSQIHIEAAEHLAPEIYHSVRIHNGCIPSGPVGSETVVIESTKYFDYDSNPPWQALRTLPGGAVETIGSPWPENS